MKIHADMEQNSVEWMIARSGKVTASEMWELVSPTGKVRDGDSVTTYLNQKLCERWTGGPFSPLQGVFDMEQGKILEERAKPAFTIHTGIEIQNVAFVETDDGHAGCSPDAMIGTESGIEIKCPRMDTHIGYLLAGKLPKQYVAQVQGSMFVTGCKTWHFFSYRGGFPPLHLIIERDANFQSALSIAIADFLNNLDAAMKRLCELNGGPSPHKKPVLRPEQPKDERFDILN